MRKLRDLTDRGIVSLYFEVEASLEAQNFPGIHALW
jgi:hypothetical protein